MKKICFFCGNMNNAGGTERVTTSISNALASTQEYEIFILNLWEGESSFFEQHEKIRSYSLFNKRVSFLKNFFLVIIKLREFLKNQKIDTIVCVDSILYLFVFFSCLRLKVKQICWEHFNFNVNLGKKSRDFARQLAARYADVVVTLTEQDKKLWIQNTSNKTRIIAINNPISYAYNHDGFYPNKDNKVVLSVGRLTYQKGFDLLIAAWALLQEKLLIKNIVGWKLKIVGEGEDKDKLEECISKLNLHHSVEILPFSKKIEEEYQNASIFCLSSRFEGLVMVLIEAQFFGLPVVAFNCPTGVDQIIIDEKSGYLVEPGNIEQLCDKLFQMINLDNEDYKLFTINSKNAVKKFGIENVICEWKDIL